MKLNKGEIICPKCNGNRYIKIKKKYFVKRLCPLCLGNRKIDWLEALTSNINIGNIKIHYSLNPSWDFTEEYKNLDHQYILKALEYEIIKKIIRVV